MSAERIAELERLCTEAYQIIGCLRFDASTVPILDNLSAASRGEPLPHETCLPYAESNVTGFGGLTSLDLPTERILRAALKNNLQGALVIGWTPDGDQYFAGSMADGADALWLLEYAKRELFNVADALSKGDAA